MSTKETKTANNILLAKFLGYIDNGCSEDGFLIHPHSNIDIDIDSLSFNSDWNMLMLVVDKIESIGGLFKSFRWTDEEIILSGYWCTIEDHFTKVQISDSAQIKDTCTKIEAVYLACIDFVKWYNLQSKN